MSPMSPSSRIAAGGAAIVAFVAGACVGWPRSARADVSTGVEAATTRVHQVGAGASSAPAGPVVLPAPIAIGPGHRLHVELQARSAARRDLARIEADLQDADGRTVLMVPVAARLTGGDWHTIAFDVVVPEGASALALRWSAVVGPLDVIDPAIVSVSSTSEQPPAGD